jgi:phosphoribosylamine--glycine ligase
MGAARDFKRARDGDEGPNTGGMGAYTPVAELSPELLERIEAHILAPILSEMRERGSPFLGFLYAGLMLTEDGPVVIEFNSRLGDPESQVVLPLLRFDLLAAMETAIDGGLAGFTPAPAQGAAVCVVMASGGYPGEYRTGFSIAGLDTVAHGTLVFQAGTSQAGDERLTAGGRVLAVSGLGETVAEARARAYAGVQQIRFSDAMWRSDIAADVG